MSTLAQDLRFALRALRTRWMVTALAVLSLGLAIGGNAAVFSMVDAFIFRPLPYPEPDRIVLVGDRQTAEAEFSGQASTSYATAADLSERSRTVTEWAVIRPTTLSVRGTERAEAVGGVAATPSIFDILRTQPLRGRLFTDAEAVEGGPRVVLVGYDYWQTKWDAGVDPLGDVLTIGGEPHEVIGVLPEGFAFLLPNQDLWVPLTANPTSAPRDRRDALAVGRLAPQASTEEARTEMRRIAAELEVEHPEVMRGWTMDTYNLRHDFPTRQGRLLFGMLQGSVLLVLIIACVNVTNLLLARGQERAREIALRTVLGAGRGRIVRQLLTESSLMVAAGAALGVGLAWLGIQAIGAQFVAALPPGFDMRLDHRVLGFTLGLSVFAGLLFGLTPALETLRLGHAETLSSGGRGASARSRKTLSRVLVVGEIALSFVALGGGSLLVRSFLAIQASDPGFEAGPVLTATLTVPRSSYPRDEDRIGLNERVLAAAGEVPGVRAAALTSLLPQTPIAPTDSFRVAGGPVDPGVPAPRALVVHTSPRYLEALGIELVQGRFFTDADRSDADPVAVVNRALADARFEGRSLGRQLVVRGESRRIVGVAEDVQQVLFRTGDTRSGEAIYLPVGQVPEGANQLVLRAGGDPRALAEPMRAALAGVDRDLTLSQVLTMDEFVKQFLVGVQVFNVVLGGFGVVALLLASLGTYGVLAYAVSRRAQEIGIRMALGARAPQVVRMIARQGFVLASLGLALGALMTLPLVAVLRSVLEGLTTVQPTTLLLIAAILFGVTMAASLVPSFRAAAVDPMRTLRDE